MTPASLSTEHLERKGYFVRGVKLLDPWNGPIGLFCDLLATGPAGKALAVRVASLDHADPTKLDRAELSAVRIWKRFGGLFEIHQWTLEPGGRWILTRSTDG
jgi:hypothetical protein